MAEQQVDFKSPLNYPNKALAGLLIQLNRQQQLAARLRAALPQTLAGHVVHGLVSGQRLLLYTEAAVWATQLRFYGDSLKQAAESFSGQPIESVQVRLFTDATVAANNKPGTAKIPSLPIIEAMQHASRHVSDVKLQQALHRLTLTLKRLAG